jgi:hypothetical protein
MPTGTTSDPAVHSYAAPAFDDAVAQVAATQPVTVAADDSLAHAAQPWPSTTSATSSSKDTAASPSESSPHSTSPACSPGRATRSSHGAPGPRA